MIYSVISQNGGYHGGGSNQKGAGTRRDSGVLVVPSFLICVKTKWVCLGNRNSLNCTHVICASFCMNVKLQKTFFFFFFSFF